MTDQDGDSLTMRNHDPRGHALKLYGDNLPSNGMEANVWGIA